MAKQTKQDFIEQLQARLGERVTEAEAVQAEIDEIGRRNTQLADVLKKTKVKVGKLKDVARFYRAQRDRVDAYLSAVLDMKDMEKDGLKTGYDAVPVDELRDTVMRAERAMDRVPSSNRRRPTVQEPFISVRDLGDGRDFAAYRDHEPSENWEDF